MTYQITARANKQKVVKTVESIKALNAALTLYRHDGYTVTGISNISRIRRARKLLG